MNARLSFARLWCALGIVAFGLAGCHIHNSNPIPCPSDGCVPSGPPSGSNGLPSVDASRTITITPGGGNAGLASSGISGTLVFASNNAVSVAGTFALTTNTPANAPLGSGTPLIYFQTQLASNVTFNAPFIVSPVVFPDGFPTGGVTFTETLYDASGNPIGSPETGAVNGQTVTFPTPPTGSFATVSSDVYTAIISSS